MAKRLSCSQISKFCPPWQAVFVGGIGDRQSFECLLCFFCVFQPMPDSCKLSNLLLASFFFFLHFYFPAFGQAHRCRPFFPPVLDFNFYRAYPRVQQSHCSPIFHRTLSSRFPQAILCTTRKSLNEFIRVCTRRGSNSRNWPLPGSGIT